MRTSILSSAAIAASIAVAAPVLAETVTIPLPPMQTELTFIEGRDAVRLLAERRLQSVDMDSVAERSLVQFCSNGEAQRAATDKGLLMEFFGQILSMTLEKVADRVRAEIAKYTAISERNERLDYYRGSPAAAGSGHLESRYQCLHFVRLQPNAAGGADVALDVVAGIALDTQRDAIVLRPLRLYVAKATARSATGHYGVAISVKADAVWRDAMVGHQGTVFDLTIATESIDLGTGPFTKYYPTDVMGGRRVPIVPVSVDVDRSRDFGRVDLTVSAAEIGTPPATLALLSQLFPLTTERRARLMIEAAIISNLPLP